MESFYWRNLKYDGEIEIPEFELEDIVFDKEFFLEEKDLIEYENLVLAVAKEQLEYIDAFQRSKYENYRMSLQTGNFSHDEIQVAVANQIETLFHFHLIEIESQLLKGRIDILSKDSADNIVGIEIKKRAHKGHYEQFLRYKEELKKLYGEKARLIILSSGYTNGLVECDLREIELWRYEIWWKYRKTKKPNYQIDSIRVVPYDKETTYKKLFWS